MQALRKVHCRFFIRENEGDRKEKHCGGLQEAPELELLSYF